MPAFISLIKYTQQGIATIKDGPKRIEAARQVFKANGGELKAFYFTLGRYGAVVIGEFANAEAAAKSGLTVGRLGNIQTETLRAFTEQEFGRIVAALP